MAAVISLAERRFRASDPTALVNADSGFFGLTPPDGESRDRRLDPRLSAQLSRGDRWGGQVRALRQVSRPGDRVLVVQAGIGILPAIAQRSGAMRVIALESCANHVAFMRHLFTTNSINAEAIHGVAHPSDFDRQDRGLLNPPAFDLALILREERVSLLMLPSDFADHDLLMQLPGSLDRVLLMADQGACGSLDRLIVALIKAGFSLDPKVSSDAVALRRSDEVA